MSRPAGSALVLTRLGATAVLVAACNPPPEHLGDLPSALCETDGALPAGGQCFEASARELVVGLDPLHFVVGDFNVDTHADVVVAGTRAGVVGTELWVGSSGGLTGPGIDATPTGCSAFPIAGPLLGGPGDDVMFATCDWSVDVFGWGDGAFAAGQNIPLPMQLRSSTIADMEGDGDADLIMLGEREDARATLSVILANGGAFDPATLQPLSTLSFDPAGITAGDFDGDGVLDLVLHRAGVPGALGFVMASQAGLFAEPLRITTALAPGTVAVADLDADGDDDVVYADEAAQTACVWLLDGTLDAAPRCVVFAEIAPRHAAVADLDGDELPEVVLADAASHSLWVWDVDLAGDADVMEPLPVPATADRIALVDFDNDGVLDIIAGHFADKTLSIRHAVP
jgi:hypothetical protein